MSRAGALAAVVVCALSIAACGADDEGPATPTIAPAPPPGTATGATSAIGTATMAESAVQAVDAPTPADLRGAERRAFVQGRALVRESGCLACHRIGASGNDALGSNLTAIGARRQRFVIRRALIDPEAPMPSYRQLPARELDALTAFLAALGRPPGGSTCPDESDCG